jgi:probable F420-dependent oxidoreductase
MKIEGMLPLGRLDPGVRAATAPLDIARVAEDARHAEALGYDGVLTEETKDDPFIIMGLAAQATSRVQLATAVAVAFPRSPAITAMSAWTLARLSNGRFRLGLGSQVKGHIERRFGVRWSPPGPWLRDYVGALRAIWDAWQHGTKLDYRSEHYNLSLMVPLFAPAPLDRPEIPVELAAVNPYMCQVAGEVADGIRAHPVATPRYISEVMLPAAKKGMEKAGRDPGRNGADFTMCVMPLVATAPDHAALGAIVEDVRARVAFYASTPTYLAAFETDGHGDTAKQLQALSRAQCWEEMPALVDDAMLDTYAIIGTHDEIAAKLTARYGGLATHLEFTMPLATTADAETLRGVIAELKRA